MEELNYKEVIERIKDRFPQGTVKKRQDNERAYIPNQVYTDRVERVTDSRWNREIRDVEINIPHGYVKVVARVTIGQHYRDGVGFAEIVTDGGKAKQLSNKVDQAINEAVREALDTWQIGWRDLAVYNQNDWGGNPALRHLLDSSQPDSGTSTVQSQSNMKVDHFCIFSNCGIQLSREEWDALGKVPGLNRDKLIYCYEHLPSHMKRKLPEDVRKSFEAGKES
jgi:hypothetical protein